LRKRPRLRWKDNFKKNFQELRLVVRAMDRIYLAQDRDRWPALFNGVIKHSNSIKSGKFLD
jgi:hypothetical protein